MQTIRRSFFLSIPIIVILGCDKSGIDPKLLNTPKGAVHRINLENADRFSPYSHGLLKAHEQAHENLSDLERVFGATDELLPHFLKIARAHNADLRQIEEVEQKLNDCAKPQSSKLHDRIEVIKNLHSLISYNGAFERFHRSKKTAFTDDESSFVAAFDRNLRTRLWLEILQTKEIFIRVVAKKIAGILPKIALMHAVVDEKSDISQTIVDLEALMTMLASDAKTDFNASLFTSMRFSLRLSLKLSSSVVLAPMHAKKDPPKFDDLATAVDQDLQDAAAFLNPIIFEIETALLSMNPTKHAYLRDIEEPLAVDEDELINLESPLSPLVAGLAYLQKPIILSLPDEDEIRFIAEYLALRGRDVVILDVSVIEENAALLSLETDRVIEWISHIVQSLNDDQLVFLRGMSVFHFDRTIAAHHVKQRVAQENLLKLFDRLAHRPVVVAIGPEQRHFMREDIFSEETQMTITPYNLLFAQPLIEEAVERQNNQRDDDAKLPLDEVMALNKISRAFAPTKFSVAEMAKLNDIVKQNVKAHARENLALKVASVEFDPDMVAHSGVLQLSCAVVERRLLENPLAFRLWSQKKAADQSFLDGRKLHRELIELMTQMSEHDQRAKDVLAELQASIGRAQTARTDLDALVLRHRNDIDALIQKGGSDLEVMLLNKKAELLQFVSDQHDDLKTKTQERIAELTKKIDDALIAANDSLDDKLEKFDSDLQALMKQHDADLLQKLTAQKDELKKIHDAHAQAADSEIQQKFAFLRQLVDAAIEQAKSQLKQELQFVLDALVEKADDYILRVTNLMKLAEIAFDNLDKGKLDADEKVKQLQKLLDGFADFKAFKIAADIAIKKHENDLQAISSQLGAATASYEAKLNAAKEAMKDALANAAKEIEQKIAAAAADIKKNTTSIDQLGGTLDANMLHLSQMVENLLGETGWKGLLPGGNRKKVIGDHLQKLSPITSTSNTTK